MSTPMYVRGVSWRRRAWGAAAAVVALASLSTGPVKAGAGNNGNKVHVIVRVASDALANPADLLPLYGGRFDGNLAPVGGFAAYLPSDTVEAFRSAPGVIEVSQDVSLNWNPTDPVATTGSDAAAGFVQRDFGRRGAVASYQRLDLATVNT